MITVPPEPRCDECDRIVEEEQIQRSARANGGNPIGPWLCVSCETRNKASFEHVQLQFEHTTMVMQNTFDTICNETNPELAEAIHRAQRS